MKKEEDDGTPISCRFLDEKGYCGIHPDKPGVCWAWILLPLWLKPDREEEQSTRHISTDRGLPCVLRKPFCGGYDAYIKRIFKKNI